MSACASMTSLGAYVLDALAERERARIDAHVAGCARCREELEALMPLADHLAHASPEELLALDGSATGPAELHARWRTAVRARRRRAARRRVAGAAASAASAALAVAAAVALVAWPDHDRRAGPLLAAGQATASAHAASGVGATVAAMPRRWGTELRIRVTGATPGERCRLIARARSGRADVAATWWTTFSRAEEVTGAAAIPIAELVALDVVTASGRRLVRIPMDQ